MDRQNAELKSQLDSTQSQWQSHIEASKDRETELFVKVSRLLTRALPPPQLFSMSVNGTYPLAFEVYLALLQVLRQSFLACVLQLCHALGAMCSSPLC